MTANPGNDFRQRLFDAQQMTPALRDAYREELDKIVHEKHTPRLRTGAAICLVICGGVVIAEIRAMTVHPPSMTFYVGSITMLLVCATAAAWIVRDLYRGKSVRKHSLKVSEMFYGAAGILTAATLMHGLAKASDPSSTFNAFYVYVFLFVCAIWGLGNRITAATLETREHLLRLESRLADLAERIAK